MRFTDGNGNSSLNTDTESNPTTHKHFPLSLLHLSTRKPLSQTGGVQIFEDSNTTYRRILRVAWATAARCESPSQNEDSPHIRIVYSKYQHCQYWVIWNSDSGEKLLGQHRLWQHAQKNWQYISAYGCHFGKLHLPFLRNPGNQPGLT